MILLITISIYHLKKNNQLLMFTFAINSRIHRSKGVHFTNTSFKAR